jgi:hypothetical protein
MKYDVSNTWNGTTYCTKNKEKKFIIVNYKKIAFGKSKLTVFLSDNKGVVIDFNNPIKEIIYPNYNKQYLYDYIKENEYKEKKKRRKTNSKKSKENITNLDGTDYTKITENTNTNKEIEKNIENEELNE